MPTDAELLTDPAVTSVSRHQKPGANRACGGAFPLADRGCDASFILLESHQFGSKAQIPTELFGTRSQDRLQLILSDLATQRRAAVTDEESVDIFLQNIKLLAHQALHHQEVATHVERCFDLVNGLLDPHTAEHLHRGLGQARDTWMDRGARMALDQQRGNASPGEEEGG